MLPILIAGNQRYQKKNLALQIKCEQQQEVQPRAVQTHKFSPRTQTVHAP